MDSKDRDVNLKKYQELTSELAKGNPKFRLKPVSDNYTFTREYKVFIIYDDDTTTEQLINLSIHFNDTMRWKLKPITEAFKVMELYQKSKE